MAGGRSYSSLTKRTTTTVDPGTSGTTLTVVDSTAFSSLDGKFPWAALINWGLTDQEIVNVTGRPSSTTLTVIRAQDGTTGQAHPVGATVDHGVSGRDFSQSPRLPDFWNAFGHSYFAYAFGTFYQSGRADSLFRSAMDIEYTNWRNRAVNGSRLIAEGRANGGWTRVMQELVRPQRNAPYAPDGGAYVLCFGINDIGSIPGSTQAQIQSMYQQVLRSVISRCRSAVVYDNGYSVGTRTTYGAGFTALTAQTDWSSSAGTLRRATTTTSATITLTIPSDYAGEDIAVQFIAEPGTAGGSFTRSGTAGITGTFSTLGVVPTSAATHIPVVDRITTLTSANAGQTIIYTLSSVTTQVLFDSWWLEANTAPPVLVLNTARLAAGGTGYSGYSNVIGDTDVTNLNTAIAPVIAEFDQMVRLCDMDSTLNRDPLLFASDGLHPNELGGARIADALLNGISVLVSTFEAYPAMNMNSSSPRAGVLRRPQNSGLYYSTPAQEPITTITPVAQDLYAAPFPITEGRVQYSRAATRLAAGGTVAGTIRWGIYDDVDGKGYPQCLVAEIGNVGGGAFSLGTTAGIVATPTSGTGSIFWVLDPGLYWICMKIITPGTGQALECLTGPDQLGIMPQLNPGDLSSLTTPIGYVIGGQGTGALPSVWPSGGFVVGAFPKMGLLVA
jgi:lysophospholipase L1-like esterase